MKFLCFLLLCPALTFAQAPDITASPRWQRVPLDTTHAHRHYLRADSLEQAYYHDSASVFFHRAAAGYYGAGAWGRYVRCLNRQAYCQYMTGYYSASLALAQYALQFSLDSLGKYHAETAEACNNTGRGHKANGAYDSAMHYYRKELSICGKIAEADSTQIVSSLIEIGRVFQRRDQYDEANAYCYKALKIIANSTKDLHSQKASTFNIIGNTYFYQLLLDSALYYYEQALKADELHLGYDDPMLSIYYSNIGLVHLEEEEYEEARRFFNVSLSYTEDNHMLSVLPLQNLGILHFEQGNYDSALSFFERGHSIQKRYDDHDTNASFFYASMGSIFKAKGLLDTAFVYLKKSLDINRAVTGESSSHTSNNYYNLGDLHEQIGAYDLAMSYYQKSLNINKNIFGEHHPDVADSYFGIGAAYYEKEDYNSAVAYIKKALDIYELFPSQLEAKADMYYYLGLASCREEKYDEALSYHQEATDVMKIHNNEYPNIAYYYQGIGNVYCLQGKYSQATKYYRKSLRHSKDDNSALGELHISIAESYRNRTLYDSAIYHYQRSISANVFSFKDVSTYRLPLLESSYNNIFHLLDALHGKASTFEARYQQRHQPRDLLAALHHYQACDSLIATMQHQYLKHSDRVAFGKTAKQVYEGAVRVSLLLAQNPPRALAVGAYPSSGRTWPFEKQGAAEPYASLAFYFAERAKAGALTLALADRRAKHFSGVPDSLLEQEKHLKQERSFYRTQHHEAQQANDDRLRQQYEDRLFTLNRRYDSLVGALEQQYPRYHQLKYTTTVRRPREVQRRLDQRTAFLEYIISDTVGYVFSMTRHRDTVHTFPMDSTLHRQLQRVASAPDSSQATDDSYAESAYGVYRRVLSDALASLPASVDRLVIVPDGRLSYVPFDVLPTTPVRHRDYRRWPYLLRRYAVSYAYSATLQWPEEPAAGPSEPYTAQLPGRSGESPRLLALAPAYEEVQHDTVAQRVLGAWRDAVVPLTWNRHEVEGLRRYLPGTFIAGGEAQEATFKQRAADYDVVHLAAHALLDDADPMQSQLVFSAATDSTEDGFLHAYELYGMDLPARLAVLSACRTGTGQLAEGEGLLSLARAFAYAGCPSVIMNGWAAHDATTARIMDRLYYYLADGYHKADALRQAKLDFLDQATAHTQLPSYWGGWMVVGDTTPLVTASSRDGWPGLVMAIALAGGLGGWWWKHRRYRTAGIRKNR